MSNVEFELHQFGQDQVLRATYQDKVLSMPILLEETDKDAAIEKAKRQLSNILVREPSRRQ